MKEMKNKEQSRRAVEDNLNKNSRDDVESLEVLSEQMEEHKTIQNNKYLRYESEAKHIRYDSKNSIIDSDIVINNLFAENKTNVDAEFTELMPDERKWYYTPIMSSFLKAERTCSFYRTEENSSSLPTCHWERGDKLLVDWALRASLECELEEYKSNLNTTPTITTTINNNKRYEMLKLKNWEEELTTLSCLHQPSDALYVNLQRNNLHSSVLSGLTGFTFTRGEYMQLLLHSASYYLVSSSLRLPLLTYEEACLLFVLYARYGNFIVLADRWPNAWLRLHRVEHHKEKKEWLLPYHEDNTYNDSEMIHQDTDKVQSEQLEYSCLKEEEEQCELQEEQEQSHINIRSNNSSKGSSDSNAIDYTKHRLSVEVLCNAYHYISEGILVNRIQRLEEVLYYTEGKQNQYRECDNTDNNDDNRENCCDVQVLSDRLNKKAILALEDARTINNANCNNSNRNSNISNNNQSHKAACLKNNTGNKAESNISEIVPLLPLLYKHPILQNYVQCASHTSSQSELVALQKSSAQDKMLLQRQENNNSNNIDNINISENNMDDNNVTEINCSKREVSVSRESSLKHITVTKGNTSPMRKRGRSGKIIHTIEDKSVTEALSTFSSLTTPSSKWYCIENEQSRRQVLEELIKCESKSNIRFHAAVEEYIKTLREAQIALQRALPIFYDSVVTTNNNTHSTTLDSSRECENDEVSDANKSNSYNYSNVNTDIVYINSNPIAIMPTSLFNVEMKSLHGYEAEALLHLLGVYNNTNSGNDNSNITMTYENKHQDANEETEGTLQSNNMLTNETRGLYTLENDTTNTTAAAATITKNNKDLSSISKGAAKRTNNKNIVSNKITGSTNTSNNTESLGTVNALLEEVNVAIPFRCTRVCKACQAGWLLPEPLPLNTFDNRNDDASDDEDDDNNDNKKGKNYYNNKSKTKKEKMSMQSTNEEQDNADNNKERAAKIVTTRLNVRGKQKNNDTIAQRSINETDNNNGNNNNISNDDNNINASPSVLSSSAKLTTSHVNSSLYYAQLLAHVHKSGVCNRAFSHLGESVLLSLPRHIHKLHREVEEELEKFLYDNGYALMEDDGNAQTLMQEIRQVYTQNLLLSRYVRRVQNIDENLHKVAMTNTSLPMEQKEQLKEQEQVELSYCPMPRSRKRGRKTH